MSWISRLRHQVINNEEFNESHPGDSQPWKLLSQGTKQAAIRTIVYSDWSLADRHGRFRHLVVATCPLYRGNSVRIQ
jgi:hypothetical protein